MTGRAARTHDAYLAAVADPRHRTALADLRLKLAALLPDADEVISYSLPAFREKTSGKIVAGYASAKHFCSYYPFSGQTLSTLKARIAGLSHTKSALHFTPDAPLDNQLLELLVATRRAELAPPLRYRPHHFMCSLGFEGKGYSEAFTSNMTAIVMGRLRSLNGDATQIEVIGELDDICMPCPKRRGQICGTQEKIEALDSAHSAILGLEVGDRLSWGEALERIRAKVAPGSLKGMCRGCEWEAFGMCETALARLHGKHG